MFKVSAAKESDNTLENAPFFAAKRKCRDVPFLILFLAYWIVMIVVASSSIANGEPKKLTVPQDMYSNYCGFDNTAMNTSFPNRIATPYLYYFDPSNLVNGTYICVSKCPSEYAVSTPTTAICVYDQSSVTVATFPGLVAKNRCTSYVYKSEPLLNRCSPIGAIGNTTYQSSSFLIAGKSNALQAVSDFTITYQVVVACILGSIFLSLLWMVLLQYFAGVFIWTIIVLTNLIFSLSATWLYFYWQQCAANIAGNGESYMASSRSILNSVGITTSTAMASSSIVYLQYVFYIIAILAGLLFLISIGMIRKIAMAVAIMKVASKAMMAMPTIVIFPLIVTIFVSALLAYYIWVILYMVTPKATVSAIYVNGQNLWTDPNVSNVSIAVHTFGFLWTLFFLGGLNQVTISGAIGSWYWSKDNKVPRLPVLKSFYRTVRYHLGSIAVGSLLIAIVEFIRIILYQLQRKAKKTNIKALQYVIACLQCCMSCVSVIVRFINRNAYIIVAITGKPFFKSAGHATSLLLKNALKVVAVDFVSDFVLGLSKLVVAAIASAVAYIYITSNTSAFSAVVYPQVSVAAVAVGSYMVASAFFSIYGMAVDTIFLCFLEDLERNDGTADSPYYMPAGLAAAMGINVSKTVGSPQGHFDDSSPDEASPNSVGSPRSPAPLLKSKSSGSHRRKKSGTKVILCLTLAFKEG